MALAPAAISTIPLAHLLRYSTSLAFLARRRRVVTLDLRYAAGLARPGASG
jgi:hypothetical protein